MDKLSSFSRIARKPISFLTVALAALTLMGLTIGPASAQFAQFTGTDTGNPFTFTNSGGSPGLDASDVNVNFFYLAPNGTGTVGSPIAATLMVTSDVNGTAQVVNLGSNFDEQPLKNVTLTFMADSPINGQTNLLTVTGADAILTGQEGTKTLSLANDPADGSLDYSSSFLTFSPSGADSFLISFSTASKNVGLTNGFLKSLDAGGATGSFSGVTGPAGVPEPSSVVTIGVLILGLASLCLRRVRRTSGGQSA
ncbi:MAG TPA: hypothetical protein VFW40_10560 [Capsulimonadaceae bacterium]|nr:hypothetical protein [Capsulimonadaceae bacterium]